MVEEKNPADVGGWTPLHCAAELGDLEICRLIANSIEDKNPVTANGATPLLLARQSGCEHVIRLLEN